MFLPLAVELLLLQTPNPETTVTFTLQLDDDVGNTVMFTNDLDNLNHDTISLVLVALS